MKTTITYKIPHTYSNGALYTDKYTNSIDEANEFVEYYKNDFCDSYKMCEVYEIITKTILGIKVSEEVKKLFSWEE